MPIYDMKCPKCKEIYPDQFVVAGDEEIVCEKCHVPLKTTVIPGTRLNTKFKLKGDGFYAKSSDE